MVILEAQVTQIRIMNVLRLITDFIKMSKVWFLSMEFYGAWQEVVGFCLAEIVLHFQMIRSASRSFLMPIAVLFC